ncbi:MAG: hypothetical protein L3K16_08190 [Thermoplasmata archaeon]|nr:hypothetical protein [Thermoplasmata archaeon]
MARTAASGAYLSGIGTMLTQTDVCTACGRVHEDHLFRFRAQPSEECPAILGAFPMMAGFGTTEAGEVAGDEDLASSEPEFVFPAPAKVVASPVLNARRSGLSIPWVMPTQSEEFL